jgi:hypothetical protein
MLSSELGMRRREFYQVRRQHRGDPAACGARAAAGTEQLLSLFYASLLLSLLYRITTMDAEACNQLSAEEDRRTTPPTGNSEVRLLHLIDLERDLVANGLGVAVISKPYER